MRAAGDAELWPPLGLSSWAKLCPNSVDAGAAGTGEKASDGLHLHISQAASPMRRSHLQGFYTSHLSIIKSKYINNTAKRGTEPA